MGRFVSPWFEDDDPEYYSAEHQARLKERQDLRRWEAEVRAEREVQARALSDELLSSGSEYEICQSGPTWPQAIAAILTALLPVLIVISAVYLLIGR